MVPLAGEKRSGFSGYQCYHWLATNGTLSKISNCTIGRISNACNVCQPLKTSGRLLKATQENCYTYLVTYTFAGSVVFTFRILKTAYSVLIKTEYRMLNSQRNLGCAYEHGFKPCHCSANLPTWRFNTIRCPLLHNWRRMSLLKGALVMLANGESNKTRARQRSFYRCLLFIRNV